MDRPALGEAGEEEGERARPQDGGCCLQGGAVNLGFAVSRVNFEE